LWPKRKREEGSQRPSASLCPLHSPLSHLPGKLASFSNLSTEMQTPQLNLLAAWSGILLGFISGLVFGLFFHREGWLGGYSSFKRRLYRLGHISFFGLAVSTSCFISPLSRLRLGIRPWR